MVTAPLRSLEFWLRFGYVLVTLYVGYGLVHSTARFVMFDGIVCLHLVMIWLRFGYGLVTFWLRFGYGKSVLVTFWLRFGYVLVTVWLRLARPGNILVTAIVGYKRA